MPPYEIRADTRRVEAWSIYQVQFSGERRSTWQDDLVRELRQTLSGLHIQPGEALSGVYMSSDHRRCDAENRLFTNPGAATFPPGTIAIRWERATGDLPPPPADLDDAGSHTHYYRYGPSRGFEFWQPATTVASWQRVPRDVSHDGSARAMWLALREALLRGDVDIMGPPLDPGTRFGLRICVHATPYGPRSAPAVSEALVDGALAALSAGATPQSAISVAMAWASKLPADPDHLAALAVETTAAFAGSPFIIGPSRVHISPPDEFCDAGEVTICPDASGPYVETSGEIFTLRPVH